MALIPDYAALRAQTMGAGNDEAVTVNTRALIDKVLARYSGEWTTLRELIQNAADASASKVTIQFETSPSPTVPVPQAPDSATRLKHVLLNYTLKAIIVENNGETFKDTDWSRLKKIAEGNPDETKIGAFGVGFYSVFSDCEEPYVSSGKQALAFYWQKDALFTKRSALPNDRSTNTTFYLPMRNPNSPIPSLMSLCQFLGSSLTFVGLEVIEVKLDEWRVMILNKRVAPSVELHIPKEVGRKTREGLMNVISVNKEVAQLDAHWLNVVEWKAKPSQGNAKEVGLGSMVKGAQSGQSLRGFFSRLAPGTSNQAVLEKAAREERQVQDNLEENLTGESTATVFVHIVKTKIKTTVSQTFSFELERATKKPPPKYTTVSLLSTSYDEQVASSPSASNASDIPKIFDTFVPNHGKGRIFIGFTTNQTTGLNVHISTPSVIPTVERESIDLNNRFVRVWNVELLRVAGILARISWGNETTNLSEKLARVTQRAGRQRPNKEDIAVVLPEALFLHNTYTFNESTPSPEVGSLIEEAFWTCNQKTAIATLSTKGIIPSSEVRLAPEQLDFVEDIPTLPEALGDVGLTKKLIDYGVIMEITISDIKQNLQSKALTSVQLQHFLEWLSHKARISEVDGVTVRSLIDVAVANDEEDSSGRIIVLGEMRNFLNVSRIPPEMPIPPTTLPFKFTKRIAKSDLELLGFEDLHLVPWLRWLIENIDGRKDLTNDFDVTTSPEFASSVLPVISKQWEGLSQSSKAIVTELLTSHTVIPTKMGMRRPAESYFPSVKLFDDLPVITGVQSVKDKFLVALGVRKTVDIGVVFERLVDTSPATKTQIPASVAKWSHVDLIKYLASVRNDIPSADITRLKGMKICPAETESLQATSERYSVSELFEPDQSLRRLKLRTMQWPGMYRPESAEGRFLTFLGLRTAPSYMDLIKIMSDAVTSQDLRLRDCALRYFIDHHHIKGYVQFDHPSITLPYLPVESSEKRAATPNTCFSNERSSILGFDILRQDLWIHASKFGVKSDPPMFECIKRLINSPPKSNHNAREVFAYFASRMSDINDQYAESLSRALIVPIASKSSPLATFRSEESGRVTHIPPHICFLGNGEKYADIFDYVDFGHEGNTFLLRIGSKHEPTTAELTRLLIREPARIFSVLGDMRYLELLRSIAASWRTLKKDKTIAREMKGANCLLAYRQINATSADNEEEDEDDSGIKSWELANAGKVVIVDDIITYNMFKTNLLAAPMEETLEDFYCSLGAPEVSSLLEETQSIGMVSKDETLALKLQSLIQERSRLFLHDHPKESIRHDAKWIEQNLRVKCVRSISLRKSLRGYNLNRNESRSAVINPDKAILYVTSGGFDMLEVSQALVPVLLQRSKPQYIFMLEMILESSLPKLRSRGYNVARLLNQKATEARIAEEARKKQLEQEQAQMKEREAAWKETQALNAAKSNTMPGLFPDSPASKGLRDSMQAVAVEEEPIRPKPRGFFDGLGRRFGFDKRSSSQPINVSGGDKLAAEAPQEDAPPPYEKDLQKSQTDVLQPEAVTAPHHLQRNLVSAIQASQAHNSTSVASRPELNNVKETATYCDAKPGHNISYIGETSNVRVFLDNSVAANGIPATKFLAANASALKMFAAVLLDCADTFSLRPNAVHIFYDDAGSTIAFNQNRSLFFNYRYFENLHLPHVQQGIQADAISYWCVVMAHELAHNLVSDHSAQHSYYTESMIIQYFGKIASKIAGQKPAPTLPPDPIGAGQQPNVSLLD